jgi:chromosomal replication initiation ATPase DnaA
MIPITAKYIIDYYCTNQHQSKKYSKETIIAACCEFFNVTHPEIYSGSRNYYIKDCRHAAIYFMNKYVMSTVDISKHFKCDHSTVIHCTNTINEIMQVDTDYRNKIYELQTKIATWLNNRN